MRTDEWCIENGVTYDGKPLPLGGPVTIRDCARALDIAVDLNSLLNQKAEKLGFSTKFLRRWDMIQSPDGEWKAIEVNTDSPAGLYWIHKLYEDEYSGDHPDIMRTFTNLLTSHQEKQVIAIVDIGAPKTIDEQHAMADWINKNTSHKAIVCKALDISYSAQSLMYKNVLELDIVYRRFTSSQYNSYEKRSMLHWAHGHTKTAVINPYNSRFMGYKSLFANLDHKSIPVTNLIYDGTNHPKYHTNKDNWVLKPINDYGGANVAIGRSTDELVWTNLLNDAASNKHCQDIMQEYVNIQHEDDYGYINFNPFFFGSKYLGTMVRYDQESEIINVSQGSKVSIPYLEEYS